MKRSKPRAVIVVTMNVAPEHEAELNRWYAEEHIPALLTVPGILAVRRFKAADGSYLAIAELENSAALNSDAYRKVQFPTPWQKRILAHVSNIARTVYDELPAAGKP